MRIVVTNGCWDILHVGHVHLLKQAKALGDYLIVFLNSDASVRRLKGDGRPIMGQEDRKAVLEAIRYVDKVRLFDTEEDLRDEIGLLQPDVLVKGADYRNRPITGAEHARRVHFVERLPYSTTDLVERIHATLDRRP